MGLVVEDMLCFPSKDEAADISNKGTPFDVLCASFKPERGPTIATNLKTAGFSVSASSVAVIWVRAETFNETSNTNIDAADLMSFPSPSSDKNPSSIKSGRRKHLSAPIRSRMKELCDSICPRGEDGAMLSDKGKGPNKRPSWCIHAIMDILQNEFDKSELDGAQDTAMRYMARCALVFKRLKQKTENDWLAMESNERERQRALLDDFEMSRDAWRQSAYGFMWEIQNIKRQPSAQELTNSEAKMTLVQDKATNAVK